MPKLLYTRPPTDAEEERQSRKLLAGRLRGRLRILAGHGELLTAGCIDSPTVTVGAAACGYDAGTKFKRQKRHIAVDTLRLLLCVITTAVSVQDHDGAHPPHPLPARPRERFSTIALVWADGGYAGRLLARARDVVHLTVTIVKRSYESTASLCRRAGGWQHEPSPG